MSNYCMHCMNEITDEGVCPHCHKQNTVEPVIYRLKPGTVLNNKYLVGDCLGEGGFGITYIGRDLMLDIRVAIKEYYPNGYVNRNNMVDQTVTATTEKQKTFFNKGKNSFLEEARKVAKFLGEPGIVGIREYFEANGTAYIIMEYLDGENLASYIKKNGNFDARRIFKLMLPITYSLKHIHEAGIIHRDISPDNIMYMKNGSLKLMDFGSARYFTNEQKEMSVVLKFGYAPEEQYSTKGKQGPWTDVYGLCATVYRCITGNVPEDARDRMRSDDIVLPSEAGISIEPAFENILMYGLAVFRENRCQNMEELSSLIVMALDDPESAAEKTALLNPNRRTAPAADEPRTTYAEESFLNDTGYTGSTGQYTNVPDTAHNTIYQNPEGVPIAKARPVTTQPTYSQNTGYQQQSAPAPVAKAKPVTSQPVDSGVQNTYYQQPTAEPKHKIAKAKPVTVNPVTVDPVRNTVAPTGELSYDPAQGGSRGVQTVTAQKPKKKKGLVIGLVIGGAVILIAAILLIIGLSSSGGSSLDGTYRLTGLVSSGVENENVDSVNFIMTVKDDVGQVDFNGDHYSLTFDTKAMTVTDNANYVMTYRVEGKQLILEDSSSTSRMVFEKIQ